MKQCPHCHKRLPDDSVFCSYCGAEIEPAKNKQQKKGKKLKPNPRKNVWDKLGVLLFCIGLVGFDFIIGSIAGSIGANVKTIYTISLILYVCAAVCGILSLHTDKVDAKKGFRPSGNKSFAYVAIFSSLFVGLANFAQVLLK